MRKYRIPLTDYEKNKLEDLSRKDFSYWNESEIREYFIVPLLNLLGYGKDSEYDLSNEPSYDLNPLFLQPGRNNNKRMKIDYICSVRKSKFWIIEAKRGYKNKYGEPSIIEEQQIDQAYFYSLHPSVNCPYFLITNGWNINLYQRDEIGEDLKPILSISRDNLVNKFLELDSYIGSTQIIPYLKRRILADIKNVLSAEVYLDRLDEFSDEVKSLIGSIRPEVIKNYKKNVEIEERKGDEDLIKFINQEALQFIPYSVFSSRYGLWQLKKISKIVLEKFKDSGYGKDICL
jgi:hypothetical protein